MRRFNGLYKKQVFPEPKALLTKQARILGTDRRKMSKSYGNAINLSDPEEVVQKKISSMITDPQRVRLADPGHPEVCNVYSYYQTFGEPVKTAQVYDWCTQAKKGCTECKRELAKIVDGARLQHIRSERKKYESDTSALEKIIQEGRVRAREVARKTLDEVKAVLHLMVD